MATLESVDEGLKDEVAEECERYGKVLVEIIIFFIKNMIFSKISRVVWYN